MTSVILQARTSSSRLPNKIFLPFYGKKNILDILLEKLFGFYQVIVATTTSPKDDVIEAYCKQNNVICFRGSEENVLNRFIQAADFYNLKKIIRICSDNPFLDVDELKKLDAFAGKSNAEYISFQINNIPSIKTHFGFWGEFVCIDALKKVAQQTQDTFFCEHVTNYIYSNPDKYTIEWLDVDELLKKHQNIRLTVDTIDDFDRAKKIYADLAGTKMDIPTIVKYLIEHPCLLQEMEKTIIDNQK
jgi:spore coat polysaccharide biosynthesis protein SpsF